jgi:hypothetical protein
MNAIFAFLSLALCVFVLALVPSPVDGAGAILICAVLAVLAGLCISQSGADRMLLLRLFMGALLLRLFVATLIFAFNLQEFFGGDAFTYDYFGYGLLRSLEGDHAFDYGLQSFIGSASGSGWGMLYLVALIYKIVGRNMLAVQFVNAVLGASTAPLIFLCAQHIYASRRVSIIAACFVAFYPSLILWSSQGLKDGPIVFLLVLSMYLTLKLGDRLNIKYVAFLACSLFGVLSLRFYIFYMLAAAIAGAFIIGMRSFTTSAFLRQFVVVLAVGLILTFFGVSKYVNVQMETYGLQQLQVSRKDAAKSAQSGFDKDVDVATTSGIATSLPTGFLYLMFAPFPWQLTSLRQSITLPEMIVWWISFPLLVLGLWFTIKFRLRQASPILIFTAMLTVAYSVFEGNVGTAYRQRAQLLVFYFIFVGVGLVLFKEKQENARRDKL